MGDKSFFKIKTFLHQLIFLFCSMRIPILIFCFFSLISVKGQAGIFGKWINEERSCVVEVYSRNQKAYGRIVWLKDSLDVFGEIRRDVFNENPSLRSRRLIGTDIFMDLQYDGSRKWADGQIYHYDSGNTYNLSIRMTESGQIRVKGYWWWFSFLGRSEFWSRYEP